MSKHTSNPSQPVAADNIETAAARPSIPERDGKGRFTAGNKGGPGNPFGRRLASMRQAILRAVSEEDVKQVMKKLVQLATEGDVAAAKLVLQYAVGKPQAVLEPDLVDVDEWHVNQELSIPMDTFNAAAAGLPAPLASFLAEGMAKDKGPMLARMIRAEDADKEAMAREEAADIEMVRGQRELDAAADRPSSAERNGHSDGDEPLPFDDRHAARPSSAGTNGGRPSVAGGNGRASGKRG